MAYLRGVSGRGLGSFELHSYMYLLYLHAEHGRRRLCKNP